MVDRRQAYELFSEALQKDAAGREAFLATHCGHDAELRREVESLLAASALNSAPTGAIYTPANVEPEGMIGRECGRFRLVERIGAGGMGVVYRAERTDGVPQTVAVKLLLGELTTANYARFQREAQILGRLEHPSVARFIDTGVQDGRTWIAIEFIRGKTIDVYCDEQRLSSRERVQLLVQLADAVSSAHRLLVVHRDINPANVLVTADGLPKLIDFGIGATLQRDDSEGSATINAARLFTPNYSAPEQVVGEPVTVATDVFGLGALAYRLLAGCTPYPNAKGPLRYMFAVTREDVAQPSLAALRAGTDPRTVAALRGDLDAVLQKALARDPARRYASTADLRADLQRYLDGLPVTARAPTLLYRLQKFARRHAVAVGAACLLAVAGLATGFNYVVQARHVAEARELAAQRGKFLENLLTSANPSIGHRDVMVTELLDKVLKQSDADISPNPLVAASVLGIVARSEKGLGRYDEAKLANDRQLALVRQQGDRGDDLVDALNLQSLLFYYTGHFREAEAPTRETLAVLHNECKADLAFADTLDILGEIQVNLQQDAAAETTYQQELACTRQFQGRRANERAVHALNNLMLLNRSRGRDAEALANGHEALALAQSALRPDAPYLLTTQLNLADTMAANHQAVEAEPLIRQIAATRMRVLGPQHLETLMTGTSLANDLFLQQRYGEAATVGLAAATGLEQARGPAHPLTSYAWQIYGNAACHAGQGDAGLKALQESEIQRAKLFGPTTWQALSASAAIGSCLVALHRYREAEPVLVAAAQGLEASRGPSFFGSQAAFADLRDLYTGLGDAGSAARWAAKLSAPKTTP